MNLSLDSMSHDSMQSLALMVSSFAIIRSLPLGRVSKGIFSCSSILGSCGVFISSKWGREDELPWKNSARVILVRSCITLLFAMTMKMLFQGRTKVTMLQVMIVCLIDALIAALLSNIFHYNMVKCRNQWQCDLDCYKKDPGLWETLSETKAKEWIERFYRANLFWPLSLGRVSRDGLLCRDRNFSRLSDNQLRWHSHLVSERGGSVALLCELNEVLISRGLPMNWGPQGMSLDVLAQVHQYKKGHFLPLLEQYFEKNPIAARRLEKESREETEQDLLSQEVLSREYEYVWISKPEEHIFAMGKENFMLFSRDDFQFALGEGLFERLDLNQQVQFSTVLYKKFSDLSLVWNVNKLFFLTGDEVKMPGEILEAVSRDRDVAEWLHALLSDNNLEFFVVLLDSKDYVELLHELNGTFQAYGLGSVSDPQEQLLRCSVPDINQNSAPFNISIQRWYSCFQRCLRAWNALPPKKALAFIRAFMLAGLESFALPHSVCEGNYVLLQDELGIINKEGWPMMEKAKARIDCSVLVGWRDLLQERFPSYSFRTFEVKIEEECEGPDFDIRGVRPTHSELVPTSLL